MQRKSAHELSYLDWPQETDILLEGNARPEFLGAMRLSALAVEASASGNSAWWAVYRSDPPLVDKDRYATYRTANSAGCVPVRHLPNDTEHHGTALPSRLSTMSAIRE